MDFWTPPRFQNFKKAMKGSNLFLVSSHQLFSHFGAVAGQVIHKAKPTDLLPNDFEDRKDDATCLLSTCCRARASNLGIPTSGLCQTSMLAVLGLARYPEQLTAEKSSEKGRPSKT